MTAPTARAETRRDLIVVAVATLVFFSIGVGARDLWNPNEPIYGLGVVEMAERGDWLVPTVNGFVFAEKPILYYWMARVAAETLGGAGELALRLPSVLAGVAGGVMLFLLVVPYGGRARARIAVALYATTVAVFWGARTVQMDFLVTVTTLGVILAVTRVLDHGLAPYRGWMLAGLAAGLGFLAKGPVAWICPGIPLLLYVLWTRRVRALWTPAVLVGALTSVVVAAPWFLLLAARGETEFLHEVLIRQNFTRFVEAWDHDAPWWYYGPYLLGDMSPWSWFLPLAAGLPGRDADERRLDLLAWLWIAGVVAFFSFSDSKRSAYILPVAPAVAVLVSGVARRLLEGRLSRLRTRLCVALLASFGVLAAAVGGAVAWKVLPDRPEIATAGKALAVLLVSGGLVVLASALWRSRARVASATAFFSLVLVLYVLASTVVLPAMDRYKSARPFTDRVRAVAGDAAPVASYKMWQWKAGYRFYLGRPIRQLKTPEALEDYWRSPERVFLIVEDDRLDWAREIIGAAPPLLEDSVGSHEVYLFRNHP